MSRAFGGALPHVISFHLTNHPEFLYAVAKSSQQEETVRANEQDL